jgi:hypothetical protein
VTATAAPPSTPVSTPPRATARVDAGGAGRSAVPPPHVPPHPTADTATSGAPPAGDYSFLDQVPDETADGRAAGDALAQKYRSGGSSGTTSTRFRMRPRIPPGVTMPERPAIATLLYLNSAQEAFHRKNGRYGTLPELVSASLVVLDVPYSAEGFRRARYGFRVTPEADGYRAEAVPLAQVGRAFLVDDSGFVRLRDE